MLGGVGERDGWGLLWGLLWWMWWRRSGGGHCGGCVCKGRVDAQFLCEGFVFCGAGHWCKMVGGDKWGVKGGWPFVGVWVGLNLGKRKTENEPTE